MIFHRESNIYANNHSKGLWMCVYIDFLSETKEMHRRSDTISAKYIICKVHEYDVNNDDHSFSEDNNKTVSFGMIDRL